MASSAAHTIPTKSMSSPPSAQTSTCYPLPSAMSVNRTGVQLRLAPTLNNQRRLINWAKDYELDARLKAYGPIAQLGERERGTLEAAGSSPAGSIRPN